MKGNFSQETAYITRSEAILSAIKGIKTDIEHMAFRQYEGRDTLDRADVLEIIDEYIKEYE